MKFLSAFLALSALTAASAQVRGGARDLKEFPYPSAAPSNAPTPDVDEVFSVSNEVWMDSPEKNVVASDSGNKNKNSDDKTKDNNKNAAAGSGTLVVDGLCQTFCQEYLDLCAAANHYFDPATPRGAPARRLIEGDAIEIPRISGSTANSLTTSCQVACAQFPRPYNPALYSNNLFLGSNSIGDTFWCRRKHLDLVKSSDPIAAQALCPAASESGGGICTDIYIQNNTATALEYQRTGADTARHLGYCQLYKNDFVADCTSADITDITLPLALQLIPSSVRVIILNDMELVTVLPIGIFDNLVAPGNIEALFIQQGNIQTVSVFAFDPLVNLQHLSLDMQRISSLPTGVLSENTKLKEFTFYNTVSRPGLLTSAGLPATLFSTIADLERVVISGHPSLSAIPTNFFFFLPRMTEMILSNNGITNTGIPNFEFDDMPNLNIFDLSENQIQKLEQRWFATGWGKEIRSVKMQGNPLNALDANVFETLEKLEFVYLHETDLLTVPLNFFSKNTKLISWTI